MDEKVRDWQVPTFEASPEKRQGWVNEAVTDGDKWVESQNIRDADLSLLTASGGEKLKTNSIKADIRKFVETIADVREIATYGAAGEQFKPIVETYNRMLKFIYQKSHFPRQDRKALQFSVCLKRGYLWPRFIRKDFGWGRGEVVFQELGPRQVLPIQLPTDHDIQGAYGCTVIEALGIAEAHARFPYFQDELNPVSRNKISSNAQVRRYEFWDRWTFGKEQGDWENRYAEIRHTWIRDLRINRTGKELQMGDENASWGYKVPSVGQLIVTINPLNGLPESRMATPEDCRLYPNLRLMISNPGMSKPLYDGPAFDWHGMIPPVAYDVDDWPWMAMGYSLLQDIAGLERAERGYLDQMYQVARLRLNPPKGYDLDAGIPREDMKRFDWYNESGTTVGTQGDPRKALVSILPDSMKVDAEDFKMLELFNQKRQKTLGLGDMSSLEKLKFNLSAENVDKILETLGPIAKGIAGNMEVAHTKIAEQLKYMIPQYHTTRDVLSIVGPDGVSVNTFDFDPDSLIPSHLPEEAGLQQDGKESNTTKIQRAKWAAKNIQVVSVPSQLLNITQMQEQLKWLNFLQRQAPGIPLCEIYKHLGVENYGEVAGDTLYEKWKNEQLDQLHFKAEAAKLASVELPQQPQGGPGKGKGGGRPPSGNAPPKLEQRGSKSGNPRTVVSQSK